MSELLRNRGITDKKSWHKWALKNHPDRGGDDETFAIAKNDYEKYIRDKHSNPGSFNPGFNPSASSMKQNPFPPGSGNWFMFEQVMKQMRNHGGGVFTPSDGFSYTYAQSYHNGGPSGKFCDIPKRTGCHNRRCRQINNDRMIFIVPYIPRNLLSQKIKDPLYNVHI